MSKHSFPDLIRRTLYAGLGAVFASEEGIRRIANEFSLPKDVAQRPLLIRPKPPRMTYIALSRARYNPSYRASTCLMSSKSSSHAFSLKINTEISFCSPRGTSRQNERGTLRIDQAEKGKKRPTKTNARRHNRLKNRSQKIQTSTTTATSSIRARPPVTDRYF